MNIQIATYTTYYRVIIITVTVKILKNILYNLCYYDEIMGVVTMVTTTNQQENLYSAIIYWCEWCR